MFNLQSEVDRLQLLNHTKIHGLPYQRKQKESKVQHIDGLLYELTAEQEDTYIKNRFINRSMDFGKRLSKRKGQRHHPGAGFAGYTGTTVYH